MAQKNEYTKSVWEKNTLIKDMVHGYIKIPKPIMRELVDSEQFQRLKDIEQTGMEALYPSATHKRFSHSLGVYHLAQKAFKAFQNNILVSYPSIYGRVVHKYAKCEQIWERWELLFQLAALLHDCGHSPFSHTLEFIYDLAGDCDGKELDKKLLDGMSESFVRDFKSGADGHYGKAHERMSSLYIKTDKYDGLRLTIEKLLKSYVEAYDLGSVYADGRIMDDDIEFMIRMIIGCTYNYDSKEGYEQRELLYNENDSNSWHIELQLRNCIIGMLNSKLDVDNLDYVVRDSKFSGYANHEVDLERLLSSFTIVRAFQVDELEVDDTYTFDYCINLKKFEGYTLKGRLTGECHILCDNKDIPAHGKIAIQNSEESEETTDENKKFYLATDDFSAQLTFIGDRKVDEPLTITPRNSDEFAYIHFRGQMSGKLSGIVFANDEESNREGSIWRTNGEERIYFAYEQKCMSVLMSAIYNSNFEKKWIYAHHISTFTNNFLYIYLLEKYAEYVVEKKRKEMTADFDKMLAEIELEPISLPHKTISYKNSIKLKELKDSLQPREHDAEIYDRINEEGGDDLVITNNIIREIMQLCNALTEQGEDYSKKFYELLTTCCLGEDGLMALTENTVKTWEAVREKYKGIVTTEMQIFSDILAMYEVYTIDGMAFYKTSDRDLFAAYKNLYMKIKDNSMEDGERYAEFQECYEELSERRYLKCLWKSQPEFEYYFSDWTKEELNLLKEMLSPAEVPKGYNYIVLSDNVDFSKMSNFKKEFWNHLKTEFKFERFVCVPQQIWTKRFVDRDTYMKRGYRVLRLKDIKLFNDDSQELDFFYFYYKQKEQTEVDVFKILDWLKHKIQEENSDDYQR